MASITGSTCTASPTALIMTMQTRLSGVSIIRSPKRTHLAQYVLGADLIGGGPRQHARWTDTLRESAQRFAGGEHPDHRYAKGPGDMQWTGVVADEERGERERRRAVRQRTVRIPID